MIKVSALRFNSSPTFSLHIDQLQLEAGRCLTLIGPSGSGKTVFLRLLCGLEILEAGRIELDGRVVSGKPFVTPSQRGIGYLAQDFGLWSHLSNIEQVALARSSGHSLKAIAEDHELLDMLQLSDKATGFAMVLSSGERQRLAMARVLARRPKILLLDEPFANLDPVLVAELTLMLEDVQALWGLTRIQVTHNLREMQTACGPLLVLNGGREVQQGHWDHIKQNPGDKWTEKLVQLTQ